MTQEQVQELFSPAKTERIEKGKNILRDAGIDHMEYVVSLQGPTFIMTVEGKAKLTKDAEQAIRELGIKILK
jgi:hypothetical protein